MLIVGRYTHTHLHHLGLCGPRRGALHNCGCGRPCCRHCCPGDVGAARASRGDVVSFVDEAHGVQPRYCRRTPYPVPCLSLSFFRTPVTTVTTILQLQYSSHCLEYCGECLEYCGEPLSAPGNSYPAPCLNPWHHKHPLVWAVDSRWVWGAATTL